MITIDPTTTLGELVNIHPQLAREFEVRGLDYCCRGGRSLADACAARGLDALATSHELADAVTDEPAADWSAMGATDLVEHLPAEGCASYVACYAGLAELEADTHLHIHKENNLLFPLVVRLESELAGR